MKIHAVPRPSLEDKRTRGCRAKVAYDSEQYAKANLKMIRKAGKVANFTDLQVYKCIYCPLWHIGHETSGAAHHGL